MPSEEERERRFSTIAELARALAPIASPRYESLVEHIEATNEEAHHRAAGHPRRCRRARSRNSTTARSARTTTAVVKNRQPIRIAVQARPHRGRRSCGGSALRDEEKMNAATSVEIPASTAAPIATPNITHDEPVVSPVIAPTAPMPVASAPTTITTPTHVAAHAAPPISSAPAATTAAPSAQNGCKTVSYFGTKPETSTSRLDFATKIDPCASWEPSRAPSFRSPLRRRSRTTPRASLRPEHALTLRQDGKLHAALKEARDVQRSRVSR